MSVVLRHETWSVGPRPALVVVREYHGASRQDAERLYLANWEDDASLRDAAERDRYLDARGRWAGCAVRWYFVDEEPAARAGAGGGDPATAPRRPGFQPRLIRGGRADARGVKSATASSAGPAPVVDANGHDARTETC